MRLSRLVLGNFRILRSLDLPLRPLNVLIGANGCGKSSLLQSLQFLGYAYQGQIRQCLNGWGGLSSVVTQTESSGARLLEVKCELEDETFAEPLTLELGLETQGAGYQVVQESLIPTRDRGRPMLHRTATSLTEASRPEGPSYSTGMVQFREGSELLQSAHALAGSLVGDLQAHFTGMAFCAGPDLSKVREPQSLDPLARNPGSDGGQLISCLYNLRVERQDVYERIEDALRVAFPGFTALDFPPTGLGKVTLLWREEGKRSFHASQLSDGTLRFLYWAVILLGAAHPTLLLLDEPETCLHPELLMLLAGMLKEAAACGHQVLVATHSDRLLRWLEPQDLVIFDREDGDVRVRRGDDPALNLKTWLTDYTLDEVWLRGGLGGRP
jgi:predicted ATPase